MNRMNKKYFFLSVIISITLALSTTGCKEDAIPQAPTVVTFPVSDIEQQTATSGGSVSSGSELTARGICWSTHQNPTIADSISREGNETGSFSSYLQNLKSDSTYYVRAYATNSTGTGYGSVMKFKTKHAQLNVVTLPISEILLSSATCGGIVTADKGISITERGLCWNETLIPTTADSKVTGGTGEGSFSGLITGLTSNKTYLVRAYATNGTETIYGSVMTFKTRQIALNVTTLSINDVTQTTATSGGVVNCELSSSITARGVCWSTSDNPTIADTKSTEGVGTGSFTTNISTLTANTTYFLRAYATNMEGTAYGSTMTFKTSPGVPTISTLAINNITSTSAKCDGKILNNGGSTVTTYGVCYGMYPNPTLSNGNSSSSTTPADNFTFTIYSLSAYTKYYVRAYATNAIGTVYGNELQFTTTGTAPSNGIVFNDNLTYGNVTDNEGNNYRTITIGTQTWMAENLRATKFRNGDLIPTTATLDQDITAEVAPIYQWTTGNEDVFGRLYTWFAATDTRNICPVGWHMPSETEWTTLVTAVGGNGIGGDNLRETGTVHWGTTLNNGLASNSSGFTALPAGYISYSIIIYPNHNGCIWWSSTSNKPDSGSIRLLSGNFSTVQSMNYNKKYGYSIRCVKD
ncbi:MAG: fibrobacter succinogenes major paralogous domain-containing protein [Paludibacter sp.]|nr:fibrobacter succinogenes major paralogous domain-containing protein [Paludibacter sp.]